MIVPFLLLGAYIYFVVKYSRMFKAQEEKERHSIASDLHKVLGKEAHKELTEKSKELMKFYDD